VTEAVDSVNNVVHAGTSEATAYTSGVLALFRSEAAYRGKTRTDFLDAIVQNHCVPPAHSSPTPPEYGAGLIRYSSATAAPPPSSPPSQTATRQIEIRGDYVLIAKLRVPRNTTLRVVDVDERKLIGDVLV
jgi:hypothetical protein